VKKISKYIITDFEKRAILNSLRECGIKGLYLVLNDEEIYYTALFEYKNMLFTSQVEYSSLHYGNNKNKTIHFIDNMKEEIEGDREFIKDTLFAKEIDELDKKILASDIAAIISDETRMCSELALVPTGVNDILGALISEIEIMLKSKLEPIEVYKAIMARFSLSEKEKKKGFKKSNIEEFYKTKINIEIQNE